MVALLLINPLDTVIRTTTFKHFLNKNRLHTMNKCLYLVTPGDFQLGIKYLYSTFKSNYIKY